MGRVLAVLVLGVISITSWLAHADEDNVGQAQRRFEAGMANYHLEAYDAAIREWEAGYRLKPAPQFLYNIAQAYRMSKRPDKALSFYQRYLHLVPDASNRVEVERHIAELTKIVEAQKQAAPTPTPTPVVASAPPPASSTQPSEAAGALTASAPPRERPVYKKGWFWGVLAGSAVLVAGAVTLGVVLGRGNGEQALPVARF